MPTLKRPQETLLRSVKSFLVRSGPDNTVTRASLALHGLRRGFRISCGEVLSLRKGHREIRVSRRALYMVPYMLKYFELYFSSFHAVEEGGHQTLDFSRPAFHQYTKAGTGFYFPSVPEEEFGEEYIRRYRPRPGDVVFDLGANAGATTWFLSKMVGERGKVFAFEPDDENYTFLLKNIDHHRLKNVVPVKKAIGASTGTAAFQMNGTMGSALTAFAAYTGTGDVRTVETLTLEDACRELDTIPAFIKMDVEGAETSIIAGAGGFLRKNPIHFALDSSHLIDGEMTCHALDKLFAAIGYDVRSGDDSGQMFTWATPPSSPANACH